MTQYNPPPPTIPIPPYPPRPPKKTHTFLGRQWTTGTLIALALIALFLVCGGIGGILDAAGVISTTTTTAAPAAAPAPVEPAAPRSAETTTPMTSVPATTKAPAWPNVALTPQTVEARLRDQDLKPTSVGVLGDAVVARYKPDVWDENGSVQHAGDEGLKTARALHDHPGIGSVRVETVGDFTDQYGKSKEDIAVWSMVTRETMAKVDWDGLARKVAADGSDWLCIADGQGTHPAIWRAVETRRCLKLGIG